jgi:hypothetical protein
LDMSFTAKRRVRVVATILFVLYCLLGARLSQSDFAFVQESDNPVDAIWQWIEFLKWWDPNELSRPIPYTNLDGQPIAGTIGTLLLQGLVYLFPDVGNSFPYPESIASAGIVLVNVLSYAGACALFFLACFRMTGSIPLSVVLSLALFLAPQMLAISILRTDFQITLPLAVVFYCSVVIAQRGERIFHAILLGVSLAFLATIKISGVVYVLFPVIASLSRAWPIDRAQLAEWGRLTLCALAAFVPVYAVLMFRYSYHLSGKELLELYPRGTQVFFDWPFPWTPRTYYNFELLRGQGIEFVVLYLVCAIVLIYFLLRKRDNVALFLVVSLLVFSVYCAIVQKYPRGGYHLLPIFLAIIGLAMTKVWHSGFGKSIRLVAVGAAALMLGSSLLRSAAAYRSAVAHADDRTLTVRELMKPAHTWMSINMLANSKVCDPGARGFLPLWSITAQVLPGPFDFPFPNFAAMAAYEPPDSLTLEKECDFVILYNSHVNRGSVFLDSMKEASSQTYEKWVRFFQELPRRYPAHIFVTTGSGVHPNRIEIYDLGHETVRRAREMCDPSRRGSLILTRPFAYHKGYAFSAVIQELKHVSDDITNSYRSPVMLCENDLLLGPAHSIGQAIQIYGRGRFVHWGNDMFFSSSDNTDPNINGRSYRAVVME